MARTDTLANYLTDVIGAYKDLTGETGTVKASELDTKISEIQTDGGNFDGNSFELNTRYGNSSSSSFLLDININQNIDNYAFSGYTRIGNVTGGENCNTIGESAFASQTLGVVNAPYVTSIGTNAFADSGITELYLPNYNASWGSNACLRCTSLKKVEIGNAISPFFRNCTALETFICHANSVPTLGSSYAFGGTLIESGTGYIYVKDELVESYKAATNWSTYADQIKGVSELV